MSFLATLRFPIAFAIGLFLNGLMFWTLYELTNVEFEIEAREATRIEFTRMRRDTQTESRREEKVEREPPPAAPDVPQLSLSSSSVEANMVSLAPQIDTAGAMSGLNLSAGADRDVVPLVRINPDYPQRALSRGLEGWVQVQFTISETGAVIDPIVVDSSPKGIFDDAAIKAISRWRYNPKIEGAVAVQRVGVQTIIRFTLEDN
ncbi:MAG: energy transducer TonB [Pseudomonadota bacterium]|nr:energy transducer TonB [Pseudomonadota bacterium]